ncbi:MAG TPA: S-layer homology domain-containing protein, partial [Candidatus Gracilibacteria bacterium]|nr:S-layer homology domain-containing protein [Candidatus Gracilibacteria bacterium]
MSPKNKTPRRTLSALLFCFLLLPNVAFASFSDVGAGYEYGDAIQAMQAQGVIKGYPDGTFKPDKLVSRAEFLKMVFNHIGYRPLERLYPTVYTDVPAGAWFAPYIKKALDLELIRYNPLVPIYLPAEPMTRLEALKILMPLEGIPTPFMPEEAGLLFQDIAADAPYRHIIHAAQDTGIFIGEEEPYFFPYRNLTRAHAAELLYRAQIYRESQGIGMMLPSIDIEDQYGDLTRVQSELVNNPKFPIFLNVWSKINQEYLHNDELDQDELVYGAISGMVDSLDDPYSTFEGPETADDITDELEGNYEGIGTVIDSFEGQFIIVGIIADSPAEKAGLKVGDIIKKIDGISTTGLDANELIDSIKGPSGTTVQITVDRNG